LLQYLFEVFGHFAKHDRLLCSQTKLAIRLDLREVDAFMATKILKTDKATAAFRAR
jgi:hypothetical protein